MIAKTQEEKQVLREGGRRHAKMLRELLLMVAPGVSTMALEEKAREILAANGDTSPFLNYKPSGARRAYPAAICVSINDCVVHGIPNESPSIIQEGDVVTVDVGVNHGGFITDGAGTSIAGKGDPKDIELIRATEEALDAAIAVAVVGNTTGDIGHVIEEIAKKYEYGYPIELGGHGVGRHVHEEPSYGNYGEPGTGTVLKEGQVLAVEPMFMRGTGKVKLDTDGYSYRTRDGERAAHSEHTILITKDGPEILTKE